MKGTWIYLLTGTMFLLAACSQDKVTPKASGLEPPERSIEAMTIEGDVAQYLPGQPLSLSIKLATAQAHGLITDSSDDPLQDLNFAKIRFFLVADKYVEGAQDGDEIRNVYTVAGAALESYQNGVSEFSVRFQVPVDITESGTYQVLAFMETPAMKLEKEDQTFSDEVLKKAIVEVAKIEVDGSRIYHDFVLQQVEADPGAFVISVTQPAALQFGLALTATFWGKGGYLPVSDETIEKAVDPIRAQIELDIRIGERWQPLMIRQPEGYLAASLPVSFVAVGVPLDFAVLARLSVTDMTALLDSLLAGVNRTSLDAASVAASVQLRVRLSDLSGQEEDNNDNNLLETETDLYPYTGANTGNPAPFGALAPGYSADPQVASGFDTPFNLSAGSAGKFKVSVNAGFRSNIANGNVDVALGTNGTATAYYRSLELWNFDLAVAANAAGASARHSVSVFGVVLSEDSRGTSPAYQPLYKLPFPVTLPGISKRKALLQRTFVVGVVPLSVELGTVAELNGQADIEISDDILKIDGQLPKIEASIYGLGGVGTKWVSAGVAARGILATAGLNTIYYVDRSDFDDTGVYERQVDVGLLLRLLGFKTGLYAKTFWFKIKWCKKWGIPYPCGTKKKAGKVWNFWLYRSGFVYDWRFPIAVFDPNEALTPRIDKVSPGSVQLGFGATIFKVEGDYLTADMTLNVPGCTHATLLAGGNRYQRTFACTLQTDGALTAQVSDHGGHYNFVLNVTPAPVINSVNILWPPVPQQAVPLTFEVSGINLGGGIAARFVPCPVPLLLAGGTTTRRVFGCTPSSSGTQDLVVSFGSAVHTQSVFVEQKPEVTGLLLTPSIRGQTGTPITFAVTGTGLLASTVLDWPSCAAAAVELTGGTTLSRSYTCTTGSGSGSSLRLLGQNGEFYATYIQVLPTPTLTALSPPLAGLNVPTLFTVSGNAIGMDFDVSISNCSALTLNGKTSDSYLGARSFSCTPTALGSIMATVSAGTTVKSFPISVTNFPTVGYVDSVADPATDPVYLPPGAAVYIQVNGANLLASPSTVVTSMPGCTSPTLINTSGAGFGTLAAVSRDPTDLRLTFGCTPVAATFNDFFVGRVYTQGRPDPFVFRLQSYYLQ